MDPPQEAALGLGRRSRSARRAGNDPSATFRTSFRATIDPRSGDVDAKTAAGHSDVLFKGLGRQGTTSVEPAMFTDKQGVHHYSFFITGRNGLSALNTFGDIAFHVMMSVKPNGDVQVDPASATKGFPSIEGFKYMIIHGELVVQVLFTVKEKDPGALNGPMNVPLTPQPK